MRHMSLLHKHHPFRIFAVSTLLTIALGIYLFTQMSLDGLWIFAILVILEVTFSFDNAVINSKILARMSPLWQQLLLTVGIIFAVFLVRFVLPIFIVMISANESFHGVIDLALNHPKEYSTMLHHAAPLINAFGGTFLLMIGVNYFLDRSKDIHWLKRIERRLSKFGEYDSFKTLVMLTVALALYMIVDPAYHTVVLAASVFGVALHIALDLFGEYFGSRQSGSKQLVGMAAFASFVYLNILDASFSLDGVIGAFAITTNVLLIMAGLGAGALWVRSLTVYLVRTNTLDQYRYLEHGAHWAILALGLIMILKLYHIELPEWFTGSVGLIFIATAVVSSIIEQRRKQT